MIEKETRNDEYFGEREVTRQWDDPAMDATDFAHPAFFRGEEFGINAVVRMLTDTLDRKLGFGVCRHEGLQALRERIRNLVMAGES